MVKPHESRQFIIPLLGMIDTILPEISCYNVAMKNGCETTSEYPEKGRSFRVFCADPRRRLSLLLSLAFFLAGVFVSLYQFAYRVYPATDPVVLELGRSVPDEASAYLTGPDWSVRAASADVSGVDPTQPGTYEIPIHHFLENYTCYLTIQDTVAPVILPVEGPYYFEKGTALTLQSFVDRVVDADSETSLEFVRETYTRSMLACENLGEFSMSIRATDRSGNSTDYDFTYIVDLPPSLSGVRPVYAAIGADVDYLSGVTALDLVDGDVTDRVMIDDSDVNYEKSGHYRAIYTVRDSYGLAEEADCSVTVATADEIQQLIGNRSIRRNTASIFGAYNIYDFGAKAHTNINDALDDVISTVVMLYHRVGRNGYVTGSGYLMEITDDTLYICTNRHVAEEATDWDVYFYDGTKVPGTRLGMATDYDVAVITVPISSLPEGILDRIYTVHINESLWTQLDEQPIALGLVRLGKNGIVQHESTGALIKVRQDFMFYNEYDHTEFTIPLVNGDSGSAIFDSSGDLIAMAFAYSLSPGVRYWGIPLDGLLDCYQSITGRRPYTY